MGDDFVDLDAAQDAEPARARGWSVRHTLLVSCAALIVLAALIAVLVWPKPAVSPEVEGLLTRPSVVERVMPVGSMVAGCGEDGLLTQHTEHLAVRLECSPLLRDARGWEATVETLPGVEAFVEPVGRSHVRVVADRITLLDAGSGERLISLPFDASGQPPAILAADSGVLMIGTRRPGSDGQIVELSRLTDHDTADVKWTTTLEGGDVDLDALPSEIVEHRGYLWLSETGYGGGFGLAVRDSDAEIPEWARQLRNMTFAGNVVAGGSPDGLRAHDLGSGRELWNRPSSGQAAVGSDDGLYLHDAIAGAIDSDTPGSLTRLDPRSGREVWSVELPHVAAQLKIFDDVILAFSHEGANLWPDGRLSAVTAVDPADGRALWTRQAEVGGAVTGAYLGEGQVVVTMVGPPGDEGDGIGASTATALDPRTGAERWRLAGSQSYLFVWLGHLVGIAEEGLEIYG